MPKKDASKSTCQYKKKEIMIKYEKKLNVKIFLLFHNNFNQKKMLSNKYLSTA